MIARMFQTFGQTWKQRQHPVKMPRGTILASRHPVKCLQIFPYSEVRKDLSAIWHQPDTGTGNFK